MGGLISSIFGGIRSSHAVGGAANILAGTADTVAQRVQDAITQGEQQGTSGLSSAQAALNTGLAGYNREINWGLNQANPTLANFYNTAISNLEPYISGGNAAFRNLTAMTAPGSAFMKPFDASMMASQDPGYQFRLQQGMKALQASGAARGASLGGAALRESQRYGQGLASSEYQDAFNRYMQNRGQTFSMLNAMAGYGERAADQANLAGRFYGGQMAGNYMAAGQGKAGAALRVGEEFAPMAMNEGNFLANFGLQGQQDVGNWLMQGANAQAAGQLGQAGAQNSIWNSVGNAVDMAALGYMGGGGWAGAARGALGGYGGGGYGGYGGGYPGTPPIFPNFGGYGGYPRDLGPNDPFWSSMGTPALGTPPSGGGVNWADPSTYGG